MKPEIEFRPELWRAKEGSGGTPVLARSGTRPKKVRGPMLEKPDTAAPTDASGVMAGTSAITVIVVKRDKAKHAERMREWRRKRKEVKCLDR